MADFDANKIAAELLHSIIKDATTSVTSGMKAVFGKILAAFREDVTSYLKATIEKCSYIKTPIINRDHPTYFWDIYVYTNVSIKKTDGAR